MKYYLFCLNNKKSLILDECLNVVYSNINICINYRELLRNFNEFLGDQVLTELEVEKFLLETL